jgi:hypothetical protein
MATAAVACATVVAACGDGGGTAGGGDAICAGAERLDAAYDEMEAVLGELVDLADETGQFDEEAREDAMELLPRVADIAGESVEAVDEMIAGAEGDVRRDLEAHLDHHRSDLEALAGASSPDEIGAAVAAVPEPLPGTLERSQRIDDAMVERCGVSFYRNPYEAILEASMDTPTPWPEVDVCSLVPTDALVDAGVVDTEGAADDLPPSIEGCEWGELYGGEGAYVQLNLWDPPIPEVLEEWDERLRVAGRTAYVEVSDSEFDCHLAVDNDGYLVAVTVDLYGARERDVAACDLAEGMATTALSSLP